MVEGVGVEAPEFQGEIGGFQATFFLEAHSAANAVVRVADCLSARMSRHAVRARESVLLPPYFWVHDIWEVAEEHFDLNHQRDFGFTFFRVGPLDRLFLAVRRWYFRRYKPWLMIHGVTTFDA